MNRAIQKDHSISSAATRHKNMLQTIVNGTTLITTKVTLSHETPKLTIHFVDVSRRTSYRLYEDSSCQTIHVLPSLMWPVRTRDPPVVSSPPTSYTSVAKSAQPPKTSETFTLLIRINQKDSKKETTCYIGMHGLSSTPPCQAKQTRNSNVPCQATHTP